MVEKMTKKGGRIVDGEDLYPKYPTLMHYTTSSGLKGILKSGSLHCTHHAFLNDTNEIETGMITLEKALDPMLKETCRELAEFNGKQGQALRNEATSKGISATELVRLKIDDALAKIKEAYLEFASPYICSFCCPSKQQHEENGLLSMWRAYGATGAYALIFDTMNLENMLVEEREKFNFFHIGIGSVAYTDTIDMDQLLRRHIPPIHEFLREGFLNPDGKSADDAYTKAIVAIITVLSYAKNNGFSEEQEARIVCSTIYHPDRDSPDRVIRHPEFIDKQGTLTPFIDLLKQVSDDSDLKQAPVRKLPIKKILVGPSVHSIRRKRSVEMFLKERGYDDVEIDVSKIPYIEP